MTEQPSTPEPTPPSPEVRPPSRAGLFLRRALRWIVGGMVLFALGVVTTWFAQVRPKATEIASLRSELAQAQGELETLRPLVTENETLQIQLTATRKALTIEEILVDVTSARISMALANPDDARSELALTDGRLASLATLFEGPAAAEVQALRDRLDLALSELDQDPFAAQSDLEVLASQLVSLRRSLGAD